jgi:hypothetical protein
MYTQTFQRVVNMKVPFKNLVVTSSFYRSHKLHCASVRETPLWNDGNATFMHEQPLVLDRNSLFGTILPSNDDHFQSDTRIADTVNYIPTGPRISGPTELITTPGNDDDTDDVIEEVDHFRFIVSKEELDRAINAKSGMTVKQRLEGNTEESSFFMDASMVQSLVSGQSEENATTTAARAYDVSLDFDRFKDAISSIDETAGGSRKGSPRSTVGQTRADEQHLYDAWRMATAQRTVATAREDDSNLQHARSLEKGASNGIAVVSGAKNNENAVSALTKRTCAGKDANWTVQRSLALTSRREILDDALGVVFVTVALTLLMASFNFALRVAVRLYQAAQVSVRYSRIPLGIRRSLRALGLPVLSILASLYWRFVHAPRRRAENLDWLTSKPGVKDDNEVTS